ncbi:DUF305 domain-containing protein [Glutamicibacter endophyticus]
MDAPLKNHKFSYPALVAVAALALAGCSTAGPGSAESNPPTASASSSATQANAADAMFAAGMAEHHQQALDMSQIVLQADGTDERVRALAEKIAAAQGPEIAQMKQWMQDWDQGMESMDHSEMGHSGMIPEQEIQRLAKAQGDELNRLFLEQMIRHHEGAVKMAQKELDEGQHADALGLAQKIIDNQQDEIDEMKQLLESL